MYCTALTGPLRSSSKTEIPKLWLMVEFCTTPRTDRGNPAGGFWSTVVKRPAPYDCDIASAKPGLTSFTIKLHASRLMVEPEPKKPPPKASAVHPATVVRVRWASDWSMTAMPPPAPEPGRPLASLVMTSESCIVSAPMSVRMAPPNPLSSALRSGTSQSANTT